jgi:hypothetical protein
MATVTAQTRTKRIDPEPFSRTAQTNVMMSGIVAGLLMVVLMSLAKAAGFVSIDIARGFGVLLLGSASAATWIFGLMIHLALSAVFALFYAAAFRRIQTSGWAIGAAFGFAHWVIAGVFLGIMPAFRDGVAPGIFAINTGLFGFFFVLVLHLMFGAIVGETFERMAKQHPEVFGSAVK